MTAASWLSSIRAMTPAPRHPFSQEGGGSEARSRGPPSRLPPPFPRGLNSARRTPSLFSERGGRSRPSAPRLPALGRPVRGLRVSAAARFRASSDLKEVLGEEFVSLFSDVKASEHDAYQQVISPWERQHLLLNV